jgi:hypothetical protein
MSYRSNFDAFVSYFEETGNDNAETIKRNLERYCIKTFVAHLERDKYSGDFRENIDNVIANCRYYILLINIDTLEREEVIREIKQAYPNGLTDHPCLVVFREDLEHVERSSEKFVNRTGIDIAAQYQHDFKNDSQLATKVTSLYKSANFVKVDERPDQQVEGRKKYVHDEAILSRNIAINKFKNKVYKISLWKYFEIKTFLFRSKTDASWKIQFLYVILLHNEPKDLEDLVTEHLRLMHQSHGIAELDNVLNQISMAEKINIDSINASLELVPNEIRYDSYYKFHPESKTFGVNEACYGLVKAGNTSIELSKTENLLISELIEQFDNLPDAVVNTLDLSFWDGTYSPFVVIFAPIPIEIVSVEILDSSLFVNLNCSSLINPDGLDILLSQKSEKGRQIGKIASVRGFGKLSDTKLRLSRDLILGNSVAYLTLRLRYHEDLIEERYFKKHYTTNIWFET